MFYISRQIKVLFINKNFDILADTDTLDLDPRSFSQKIEQIEFDDIVSSNEDKKNLLQSFFVLF